MVVCISVDHRARERSYLKTQQHSMGAATTLVRVWGWIRPAVCRGSTLSALCSVSDWCWMIRPSRMHPASPSLHTGWGRGCAGRSLLE